MPKNSLETEKIVIIGSGPAGWTASIYASRAMLNPVIYEGLPKKDMIPGGQLMFTGLVENYPGFSKGILGPELMENMKAQAINFDTKVIQDSIVDINLKTYPFELISSQSKKITAFSIIIATGTQPRWLGLENETRLKNLGGGISTCAICDGSLPIFRNQNLAVVGGGDAALEEALYLSKVAKEVFLIHRRDQFRASKIVQDRVFKNKKINIYWNSVIKDILGEDSVEGLTLENLSTNKTFELSIKGLFIAIGHIPNTEFLKSKIELDAQGYIIVNKKSQFSNETSVEGVFASGDVIDPYYRQAITSAASGAIAAIDAEKWLTRKGLI